MYRSLWQIDSSLTIPNSNFLANHLAKVQPTSCFVSFALHVDCKYMDAFFDQICNIFKDFSTEIRQISWNRLVLLIGTIDHMMACETANGWRCDLFEKIEVIWYGENLIIAWQAIDWKKWRCNQERNRSHSNAVFFLHSYIAIRVLDTPFLHSLFRCHGYRALSSATFNSSHKRNKMFTKRLAR